MASDRKTINAMGMRENTIPRYSVHDNFIIPLTRVSRRIHRTTTYREAEHFVVWIPHDSL